MEKAQVEYIIIIIIIIISIRLLNVKYAGSERYLT